jgi:hypothetical protein
MGMLWGLLWPSVHEKMAEHMQSWDEWYDYGDILTLSKSILPVYQEAVLAGYPAFDPNDSDTNVTVAEVAAGLNYSEPYQVQFLIDYLTFLKNLAGEGVIEQKHYDPTVETNAPTTNLIPGLDPGKAIESVTQAFSPEVITSATGNVVRFVVITGAVVAVVYLLGKEAIRYGWQTT